MQKSQSFLFYTLLLINLCIVLVSSCKKDEDFNNDAEIRTMTDSRDGNVYKIIKIDDKEWMAENMKYLPRVIDPGRFSLTIPCYYVYDYDGADENKAKGSFNYRNYGVLYNWAAAQGACPDGWHLPTDEEWTQLTDYLGGESVAGGKLRDAGKTYWHSSFTNVTNETGFTALPGGFYKPGEFSSTGFSSTGFYGYWWSATEANAYSAWYRGMGYNATGVSRKCFDYNKLVGLSVRCVQD